MSSTRERDVYVSVEWSKLRRTIIRELFRDNFDVTSVSNSAFRTAGILASTSTQPHLFYEIPPPPLHLEVICDNN